MAYALASFVDGIVVIFFLHNFRSFKELLDLADAEGSAPLHLAEEKGMYSKVEVLLEFGAG